jgi:hypothetical protein
LLFSNLKGFILTYKDIAHSTILMKSYFFTVVFFLSLLSVTCTSQKNTSLPACIRQRIDSIKNLPVWNPPAEVHEYKYQGKTVYYFTSDCCDQFNMVVDVLCQPICAPSGGITGKGDRKCEGFLKEAEHIRLVWKDDRK